MGIKSFVYKVWTEIINAKLGLLSFAINFSLVYYANHEHGWVIAAVSALKDGVLKFFAGGFFGRISERFSEIRNPFLAYPLGSIVPTILAYAGFFLMHSTTYTPEPEKSTIYPMLFSMFISTPTTIFILRRGYLRQNMKKPAVKDRGVWERKVEKAELKKNKKEQNNQAVTTDQE